VVPEKKDENITDNQKKFKNALKIAYEDGVILNEEQDFIELKKKKHGISDVEHIRLEIEVLLELGREAVDNRRMKDSLNFIDQLIQKDPSNEEHCALYTCLLILNGDYEKAKDGLEKCMAAEKTADTPEEKAAEPACPDCSGKIRFIEQYKRYYCDACKKYLPADFKPEEKKEEAKPEPEPDPAAEEKSAEPACPDCSGKIRFIEQYKRYYCDACKKYLPADLKPEGKKEEAKPEPEPEPAAEEKSAEPACPDCSGKIRFIEQYKRYYCDACKKYLPADFKPEEKKEEAKPEPEPAPAAEEKPAEPACPDCSGKIRFIEQYKRYYCDACKKYLPADFKPEEKKEEAKLEPATAPAAEEKPAEPACPDCSGKIRFIEQYKRYYCDACKKYLSADFDPNAKKPEPEPQPEPEPAAAPAVEEKSAEPACPDCSGKIRFIEQYKRYYCDACKKYLPADFDPNAKKAELEPAPAAPQPAAEPACPDCSGKIRFIEQYKRYYCDACKKYLPADFKP